MKFLEYMHQTTVLEIAKILVTIILLNLDQQKNK